VLANTLASHREQQEQLLAEKQTTENLAKGMDWPLLPTDEGLALRPGY
jgi:hypothetical protein